ncbi:MAG: hypothetical protein EA393_05660 [Bacteroidetes bacterium]|nr:MAG: hypothetical protein EA393_05660 [Bacteroidota bacterium]
MNQLFLQERSPILKQGFARLPSAAWFMVWKKRMKQRYRKYFSPQEISKYFCKLSNKKFTQNNIRFYAIHLYLIICKLKAHYF